ncbi:MAG TPA: sigma-70 family RNA polymerase sigma factor [Aliidongia sp.]|nr:sigma-70 family RNA polymerase sigma factor [Aliidongia sp.]
MSIDASLLAVADRRHRRPPIIWTDNDDTQHPDVDGNPGTFRRPKDTAVGVGKRGHLVRWRLLSGPERSPTTDLPDFEQVVLPHLNSAHNVARWLVRDASLAEDVVQEAVLRALNYFPSFRGGDARPWLLRIVRNVAYHVLTERKQRAETSFEEGYERSGEDAPALYVPDPADNPEAALAKVQDLKQLERALAALPAEQRECVILKELEGFSYKQIAEVTGVPIGTVMSRLSRARQALMGSRSEGCKA